MSDRKFVDCYHDWRIFRPRGPFTLNQQPSALLTDGDELSLHLESINLLYASHFPFFLKPLSTVAARCFIIFTSAVLIVASLGARSREVSSVILLACGVLLTVTLAGLVILTCVNQRCRRDALLAVDRRCQDLNSALDLAVHVRGFLLRFELLKVNKISRDTQITRPATAGLDTVGIAFTAAEDVMGRQPRVFVRISEKYSTDVSQENSVVAVKLGRDAV